MAFLLTAERPNLNVIFPLIDVVSFQLGRHWVFSFIPMGFFGRILAYILRLQDRLLLGLLWHTGVLLYDQTGSTDPINAASALLEQVAIAGSSGTCVRLTVRAPIDHPERAVEMLKLLRAGVLNAATSFNLQYEEQASIE